MAQMLVLRLGAEVQGQQGSGVFHAGSIFGEGVRMMSRAFFSGCGALSCNKDLLRHSGILDK